MRRHILLFLSALILALLFRIVIAIDDRLPIDAQPLIEEKYSGWSGVLRLWIYEGWTPGEGSLSPWMNKCIAAFEKAHEGVYIQPQYVDAAALTALGENGILMPDMILFPPGLLDTPAHLLPLDTRPVRPALSHTGEWMGMNYAIPIAMGGYAWAHRMEALPDTLEGESVSAPLNDAHHHWAAALTALCSGRYIKAGADDLSPPMNDMDLGLSIPEQTPAPSATPVPADAELLPFRLPTGFAQAADAYTQFINSKVTAMPITQREARRMAEKAGEWRMDISGAPFTDQICFIAITEQADARGSGALCGEFIDHLLSGESQGQLYRAGAFSTTEAFSGYPAYDILNTMEGFLRREDMMPAPAFGRDWISRLDRAASKFLSGDMDAWALMGEMRAALG